MLLCGNAQEINKTEANKLRTILEVFFNPVETDTQFLLANKNKINLGRHLFFDERLSTNATISCNSCHNLNAFGTNGSYYLDKHKNGKWFRDVPTLYNVHTLSIYNADGGINTLKDKINDAFSNGFEMHVTDKNVIIDRLKAIEDYRILFNQVYVDDTNAVSFNNIVDALQTFIKGLTTPAPIDKFIKGDNKALSKMQIQGGHIFNDKNCYSCHTGSNIGGQMIQKLGVEFNWPNQKDLGYYNIERNPDYKMFFRVSPLRNVEKTSPYFHDRTSKNLEEAVQWMGKYERGLDISASEAKKISAFLKGLTGEIPSVYIKKPTKLVN
ncbi:cytochrome-c peroxidase [Postechiella marina]|uniref:Cytochrome-c peroxidase n=1 Tax=Postechiella marina TaxID=943941 RepID=A0ABP8CCL4_9FLAO